MDRQMWRICVGLALLVSAAFSVTGVLAQEGSPPPPQVLVVYEPGQCQALVPFGTDWHPAVEQAAAGQLENVFYEVVDVSVYAGAVWVHIAAEETGGSAYVNTNNWSVELDVACIFNSGLGEQPAPGADAPPAPTFHIRYPFGTCVVLYIPPSTPAYPASLQEGPMGTLTDSIYIVWDATRYQDTDWLVLHDTANRQPIAATVRELTGRVDTSRAAVTPGCVAVPGLLTGN